MKKREQWQAAAKAAKAPGDAAPERDPEKLIQWLLKTNGKLQSALAEQATPDPGQEPTGPKGYDRDMADRILDKMASGFTLTRACRLVPGAPRPDYVRLWALDDVDGFHERYARARRLLMDAWADQSIDIADDESKDMFVDERGRFMDRRTAIERARMRLSARQWLMGRLAPNQYGDKVQVALPPGEGQAVFVIGMRKAPHDPLAEDDGTTRALDVGRLGLPPAEAS